MTQDPGFAPDFLSLIETGDPFGVAVSGGGDSLALLCLMHAAGARVFAATVNHNLREEASDEARWVASFCATRGIVHTTLDWTDWDGRGNLQDQARRARYDLLARWAARIKLAHVALGHTQDDNIETFLLGLARGAGLGGLSGMRPVFVQDGVQFHRPLLTQTRRGLRTYLRKIGVEWLEDPSNDDPRFDRIKTRQALDALEQAGIPRSRMAKVIHNLATTRRDVADAIASALRADVRFEAGDLVIARPAFEALGHDFQRLVLNAALRCVSGASYAPRAEKTLRLIGEKPKAATLHGCKVSFEISMIRVSREYASVASLHGPAPGRWDMRWYVDGPSGARGEIRALGEEGLRQSPYDWRDTGLRRDTVLSSPSVWEGASLIAAPLLDQSQKWRITLRQDTDDFFTSIYSH